MGYDFFNKKRCDRCGKDLKGCHTMSWFTDEVICLDKCSDTEFQIKQGLKADGIDPHTVEGAGIEKYNELKKKYVK